MNYNTLYGALTALAVFALWWCVSPHIPYRKIWRNLKAAASVAIGAAIVLVLIGLAVTIIALMYAMCILLVTSPILAAFWAYSYFILGA